MRSIPALAAACLLAGCQGRSKVVENPVVGPPPPRIPGAAQIAPDGDRSVREDLSEVVQIDAESHATVQYSVGDPESGLLGPTGEVAARVNGTPIFAAEILEPYARQLAEVRAQVPEAEFERLRRQLVARDLPQYIEQMLLYEKVMSQLEPDAREQIDAQLGEFFQMHLENLMAQMNMQTLAELEAHLQESGTSLDSARRAFERQEIAMQFLRESVNANPAVSRSELLAEYHARSDEYTHPARVRWQQIRISSARHGGEVGARRAVEAVLADLAGGMPFDEAARRHSDGPLAAHGGEWDWTQPDSISNDRLQRALKALSVGDVSEPIELEQAFLIVRLTGSRPQETTPFEDVQDELRESIRTRKREEGIRAVVEELKAEAVITTMFDEDDGAV